MQPINKIVATVSPNIYAAAKSANLSPGEATQIEQMSYTIDQHRKLSAMNSDAARNEFNKLDDGVQKQLKFMYKNAPYMQQDGGVKDAILGVVKGASKIAASPLIGLFKVAGAYNRVINTPYLVGRQLAQAENPNPFSTKVWTDAWDGRSLYDNVNLKKVTDYFGKYDVEVAKGLLAGKKPGEIVQGYGKVDTNILESIKKAFNEPEMFKEVLDAVKFAQVSPGRDLGRMLDNISNPTGYHAASNTAHTVSGITDFIYQIGIDPLTWLTGGASKGITKGERIANTIIEATQKGTPMDIAVADAFATNKELFNYWENGMGKAVEAFAKAETPAAKQAAVRNIKINFPGYDNQSVIKGLAEAKVFNAKSAQEYFSKAEDLTKLLSGRVDGISFMRNGVAVAKKNRVSADNLTRNLDSFFNPRRSDEALNAGVDDIHKILTNPSEPTNRLKADYEVLKNSNTEIKKWRGMVAKMVSRSPVGMEVRTGKNAIETASNFTARARQIFDRDMAEAYTQKFLEATADEQFVILRNLDAAVMYSMGLGGDANGEKLIVKILREKYGNEAGFATKKDLAVPPQHADVVSKETLRQSETGIYVDTQGPLHPYQSTFAVGSLPYHEIGDMVWNIRSKKNIMTAIGGSTQGKFAKDTVDAWSILTLFPRLGIRSAIDEATMYAISAPSRDIFSLVTRQGNKMGNVAKSFVGGKDYNPFSIKDNVHKVMDKLGFSTKNVIDTNILGKKVVIDPEHALTIASREDAINKYAKAIGTEPALLNSLQKRTAVAEHIENLYSRYLNNETDLKYLLQAFKHSPDALSSMAQSLVAYSALSGKYGQEVMKAIVTPSQIDKALEEIGVKMSAKQRVLLTSNLSDSEVSLAHFEKWFKMLVGNKARMDDKVYLNPANIFFENGALRTAEDFTKAVDDGMRSVGFKFDKTTNAWKVDDEAIVDSFLSLSSHTVVARSNSFDDALVAKTQLERMFIDMYETFHGSADKFNDNLLAAIKSGKANIFRDSGKEANWNQASATVSLHDFQDLTNGYRIQGEINTAIDFGNFDAENIVKQYGNMAMEVMDRQVTGMFRQPAVMITYVQLRKKYAGIESQMAKKLYMARSGHWENASAAFSNKRVMAECEAIAEKHFTELAVRDAADTILKYADNPAIRSNFAYSARTVGRYYRATEDFYRRLYRLKDVSPRVLYRMRLAHLGLDASGMFHQDQNGNAYVVMPMDNIIFKATDTTMRALTGNLGYSQPNFNQFTLKLNMMNPSFSQDAGLPTLSGPIAGLSVIAIKDILGTVPAKIPFIGKYLAADSKKLGESIDTVLLGNIGDNIDITRAIVPASLQKAWAMLPLNEQSRQEVTAAQQAIAYNAAHGRYLDASATAEEKAAYLNNIRISAHNIVFLRNLLALIAPVAPTPTESKGVPNYLKDVGLTSLRSEFFDILNGISMTNNGEVTDPYEQALVTFMGKYPGKLIYTVSREDKQTKVIVKNTNQLKNWAIQNESLIKKYGEVAYIFAPQVGKFNAATFNWIQASGLMVNKSLEQYYSDLLVATDKQHYYDIARNEKDAIAAEPDPYKRAEIIGQATAARDALKRSNPLLEQALIGSGNNIGSERTMLTQLKELVDAPNSPIEPATRQRMSLAIQMMSGYIRFATDPEMKNVENFVDMKRQRKAQIEADLQDLMLGDLYVTEANRAIFKSILNFYSRDSYVAFQKGF
jgi:hypothetical protein